VEADAGGRTGTPHRRRIVTAVVVQPRGARVGEPSRWVDGDDGLDAVLWIKTVGESDGGCGRAGRADPPAGEFNPDLAHALLAGDWDAVG
jgi:cellulase/cellobiase CelA1